MFTDQSHPIYTDYMAQHLSPSPLRKAQKGPRDRQGWKGQWGEGTNAHGGFDTIDALQTCGAFQQGSVVATILPFYRLGS